MVRLFKKGTAADIADGALKKKTLVCSTEAAAISIGFHLALLFFAGSIVAIRYVQKRDAAFAGENINRPKLERRQLQMPVKVQNLQKKSSRPKVTARMTSVSQTAFALPDITALGNIGPAGFERGGAGGERDLSALGSAGSLGFGMSGINFFGARSKGEKIVFVIEAAKTMVEDRKGAYFTYRFVKDRLHQMVNGMNSATLFNAMLFSGNKTVMFRPQLVPATPENKAAFKAWLVPVNASPEAVGRVSDWGIEYSPSVSYEDTLIKDDAKQWVKSVQASMEQKADNVFVLCAGWGIQEMNAENRKQILGIDIKQEEIWRAQRGWPPERVQRSKDQISVLKAKAEKILAEENQNRAKKGLPPKIIADSGWWNYMFNELKLTPPEMPPDMTWESAGRSAYNSDEVIGHLDAVYRYNYVPQKLEKPKVHIVALIAEDGNPSDEMGEGLIFLKNVAQAFRGRLEFLRGAKTMENLVRYNPDVNEE